MKTEDLVSYRLWFSDYCRSFSSGNEEDLKNIALKETHTYNVCGNIMRIARELSLPCNHLLLAETTALFHDVGRFNQYARYRTFRDSISVNHAVLGATVLSDSKVLDALPEEEREPVLQAVKFHNALAVPDMRDDTALLLLKLIRDADKLDIWRLFIDYYESPNEEWPSAAGPGLPDTPEYSDEVLSCIFDGGVASLASLKTLNDFKLMKLSWIYDLNFGPSLRMVLERDYIGRLVRALPRSDEIVRVPAVLENHIHHRLKEVSHA